MNTDDAPRCSDVDAEPLPGTAKQEAVYVILEHPYGWSRDILDGDTFGEELTAQVKAKLKGAAGLQLIRRPGRAGRNTERPHLFIVHAEQATIENLRVDGPADILDLDLTNPGANGGEMIDHPLILVCTHGKRDVCCALKGRPLARQLADSFEGVWETTHTKGHRFAPSLLLMPWGYSFGRLNESAATALVRHAQAGDYFLPGNRGRGIYGSAGQVAEIAVASELVQNGESLQFGDLNAQRETVTHRDGRAWTVDLEQQRVEGVVASCGKPPKIAKVLVANSVQLQG